MNFAIPKYNTLIKPQAKNDQIVTPQIIELAQAGDKEAMAMIYQNYAPAIYGLIYRMVWQRETAQELMQDSFIDVLTHMSSYRAESGLYAWMRRIAVNRCLMHFRKYKHTFLEFDQNSEPSVTENNDAKIDIESLVKRLTPKRRMIVWLHEVEGMTHKAIADVMGKSVSFSKMELSRAMQQLSEFSSDGDTARNEVFKKKLEIINDHIETNAKTNSNNNTQNEVALCTPLLNNS